MSNKNRKARRAEQFSKAPVLTPGSQVHPLNNGPLPVVAGPQNRNQSRGSGSPYNDMIHNAVKEIILDLDTSGNWFSPGQPVMPFGPPTVRYPRTFDYKTYMNLDIRPERMVLFDNLRILSRSWGILRTVIETRKDQFMRMPWAFQIKGAPGKRSKHIDFLNEFFRKPDGKNTFTKWRRLLLEDLLVLDAPCIYKWRAIDGTPIGLDIIDGATIKPLVDDAGRRPTAPSPAYQQIIKGLPMTNWTEDDLLYAPMRPVPNMPVYGYPPVEQIITEVLSGIKRLSYQLSFWTEGSMPELIVTVPETWTPTQLAQYQGMMDAMLSGNIPMKSKIRFMPGGMKPFDIKNANGEALKAEIDEWWARLICYAYGVSPTPFIRQNNRATAVSAAQSAEEEGLHPLMMYFKEEIMDPLVQDDFGFDELEFNFLPNPEVDQQKQMLVLTGYVKEGIFTRDEARDQLGMDSEPGGDILSVDTPTGPMPVKELLEANRTKLIGEPDRTQEAHDADVAETLASAKQKAKTPHPKTPVKKGVGESVDAPFLEGSELAGRFARNLRTGGRRA